MYEERRSSGLPIRLLIGVGIAAFSACSYFTMSQTNPVTREKQHVSLSPQQETALGLQAVPEMEQQFGGPDPDSAAQTAVDDIGQNIVAHSDVRKSPYRFEFTALADNKTVNAFALPGGQVFVTHALLSRLKTKDQLAGVLAHEITHVVGRHGAEQMAQQKLTQGLAGAAGVATTDPNDPRTYKNAALAQAAAALIGLKYSRADESEADERGVHFMHQAGYDPRAMIEVMEILKQAGGAGGPEFFQSHPSPDNRIGKIKEAIRKEGL